MTDRARLAFFPAIALLSGLAAHAAPAGLFIPHPDAVSKRVEYFLEKPAGEGPWPTVVLLHGHQGKPRAGGRDFVDWGVLGNLASRGYLAVAVSQPGYGRSSGPPDFCGPFTQHAVSAVLAKLKADGLIAPGRLLLQGVSRGAVTAGLIAARDESVTAVVLISGAYDLIAEATDPHPGFEKLMILKTMKSETGGAREALVARSVLHVGGAMKAEALILNGAKDEVTDARQAQQLAALIGRNGGRARAIVYPDFGHRIPVDVRNADIDPFIDRVLRGAPSTPRRE